MQAPRRTTLYRVALALLLASLAALLAHATAQVARELAELLDSEVNAGNATPPPYALYRAFSAETAAHVARTALPPSDVFRAGGRDSRLSPRDDGLLDRTRTVVSGAAGKSVDVCFRFHTRFFFRPSGGDGDTTGGATTAGLSSLQLWPYFYQYERVMGALAAQTVAQTQHGVLDVDAAALSLLYDIRNDDEFELVVLAYNDWDAHADEALAALADFARQHSSTLYGADGREQVTAPRARNCGRAEAPPADAVLAVRRGGFNAAAAGAAAPPHLATPKTDALYATLRVEREAAGRGNAAAAGGAGGVMQLIGAARMAAFDPGISTAARAFVELQHSASPRFFFITSRTIGVMNRDTAATTGSPPSLLAERGATAGDVHRFVHQHTRSSLLLRNTAAYHAALQLHGRIAVLIADPAALPPTWWATLSGPPNTANAALRALRGTTPFFLLPSAGPVPTPAAALPGGRRRCLLPGRRLPLGAAVRAVHGDRVDALLQTVEWRREVLQLRVVQLRPAAGGDAEADCVWVQVIDVPCPTPATDAALYDAIVMPAVAEVMARAQRGEGDWVGRLRSTTDFARQLDRLLQPTAAQASRHPPQALLMAVEAVPDCSAALQLLRRGEQDAADAMSAGGASIAASATYATLARRLTTVVAELHHAAEAVPMSALPQLLSVPAVRLPRWTAVAARCPLFAVMRKTGEVFVLNASASGDTGTEAAGASSAPSAALEGVADEALVDALMDLYAKLPASADGTASPNEEEAVAAEVRSGMYVTPQRRLSWGLVLPPAIEAPLLFYQVPRAAQGVLTATLPASAPTFVLLVLKECGLCANYWKAFELLRLSYRRTTAPGIEKTQEGARFVLVDLALGFTASCAAAVQAADGVPDTETQAHWQRAQDTLWPSYLADVTVLAVPQLLLMNGTHVLATLGTEAYAERWQWPHALLRLMALIDPAVDVEATKTAMWSVLSADRAEREHLRTPAP